MNSTIEDLGFRKFSKMVLKLEINCQINGSRSSLYAYLVRRVGEQYERENTLRPMILVKLPSRRFIFIQKKMLKRSDCVIKERCVSHESMNIVRELMTCIAAMF